MDRLTPIALAAAVALGSCAAATAPGPTSGAAEPTAIFPSLAIETGTPPPLPSPTIVPAFTPRRGGCTSPGIGTRELLDRYFSLTTSGDPAAVLDCFAAAYRERHDASDMRASAISFASHGRLAHLEIAYVDTVRGCDRYAATFQFERADPLFPNGFAIFYTVGPDGGAPRIWDGGTGLAAERYMTFSCR